MNFYEAVLQANLKNKWFRLKLKNLNPDIVQWYKLSPSGVIIYATGERKDKPVPISVKDVLANEFELKEE